MIKNIFKKKEKNVPETSNSKKSSNWSGWIKKVVKNRIFISIVALIATVSVTSGAVLIYFNTASGKKDGTDGASVTLKDIFSNPDKKIVGSIVTGSDGFVEGMNQNSIDAKGNYVTKADAVVDDDLVVGGSTVPEDGSRYYAESFVSTNGNLQINGYFADNMMFQQNRPVVVQGMETGTGEVRVKMVRDRDQMIVSQNKAKAANGLFYVRLPALKGSFETYTLVIEGSANKKVNNVLVGELWVAGGQSNMELPVEMMLTASSEIAGASNSNLRFFQEIRTTFDNNDNFPPKPQFDVTNQFKWGKGDDKAFVAKMSAIGYVFAREIYSKLNVPVGVIDIAIGGTSIEPWISRDAIESSPLIHDYLVSKKRYLKEEEINASPNQKYNQMSVQYNKRVAPIKGTNVKGVLWYQGEGNAFDCFSDYYANALRTLTKEWSSCFGSTSKQLPFVFVNIAPYSYGTEYVPLQNEKYLEVWSENREKFALVATYDQSLVYKLPSSPNPVAAIHPIDKAPIGQRCALAAMGIAYSSKAEYMSPVFESATIKDNKITITFSHTGDGLRVRNGEPEITGFTLAGSNGKFLPAKARIVSKNSVELTCDFITAPRFATYGFTDFNMDSNLENSIGMPAIPFRSQKKIEFLYYRAKQWTFAHSMETWILKSDSDSSYAPAWEPLSTSASRITAMTADKGVDIPEHFAIKVSYTADVALPVSFGATQAAVGLQSQYTPYSKINFTIENPDSRDKNFSGVRVKSGGRFYFAGSGVIIPAGGSKTISVDIWNLKDRNGNAATNVSTILSDIQGIYFEFSDSQPGTLYIHSILFRT